MIPIHERKTLPFPSILVASRDDNRCPFELAAGLARDWGSEFVDAGHAGHLNAESGLGDWPQGHALLQRLMDLPPASTPVPTTHV